MYEFIRGKIDELTPAYVIIEANQIGYHIGISLYTYEQLAGNKDAKVYVDFIVREDGQMLYGFATKEEREIFRLLVSVSGIGPASAVLMLSSLSPDEVREAIATENIGLLKSVKGIGPKTAKRLVVELKDKILKNYSPETTGMPAGGTQLFEEAVKALEVLGYPRKNAEKVVRMLIKENPGWHVEKIIKTALKRL